MTSPLASVKDPHEDPDLLIFGLSSHRWDDVRKMMSSDEQALTMVLAKLTLVLRVLKDTKSQEYTNVQNGTLDSEIRDTIIKKQVRLHHACLRVERLQPHALINGSSADFWSSNEGAATKNRTCSVEEIEVLSSLLEGLAVKQLESLKARAEAIRAAEQLKGTKRY